MCPPFCPDPASPARDRGDFEAEVTKNIAWMIFTPFTTSTAELDKTNGHSVVYFVLIGRAVKIGFSTNLKGALEVICDDFR